jgi:hypothetical protein
MPCSCSQALASKVYWSLLKSIFEKSGLIILDL